MACFVLPHFCGIKSLPSLQNADPTPRADRIEKDYEKEYPDIEIEGRRTVRKSGDRQTTKNIENVCLDGEVGYRRLSLCG